MMATSGSGVGVDVGAVVDVGPMVGAGVDVGLIDWPGAQLGRSKLTKNKITVKECIADFVGFRCMSILLF
jgi:hypothetical protein